MAEKEQPRKTIVNSWNEWDPLKHVIVGRADGTMVQAPEPSTERDWPEHGFPLGTYGPLLRRSIASFLWQIKSRAEWAAPAKCLSSNTGELSRTW